MQILTSLGSALAPLVPLLVEEVWRHGRVPTSVDRWPEVTERCSDRYGDAGRLVHTMARRSWLVLLCTQTAGWRDPALAARVDALLEYRGHANAVLEQARSAK